MISTLLLENAKSRITHCTYSLTLLQKLHIGILIPIQIQILKVHALPSTHFKTCLLHGKGPEVQSDRAPLLKVTWLVCNKELQTPAVHPGGCVPAFDLLPE